MEVFKLFLVLTHVSTLFLKLTSSVIIEIHHHYLNKTLTTFTLHGVIQEFAVEAAKHKLGISNN